jgi:hypothetical protein
LPLLLRIKDYFGGAGGIVIESNRPVVRYTVAKLDHVVNVIIPHFLKYPLQSGKRVDFQIWKECVELIAAKEHLTEDGINKILSKKSTLN